MDSNKYLEDRLLRHSVYIQRLAGGYVKELIPYFDDLLKQLESIVTDDSYSLAKRSVLLEQISQLYLATTSEFSRDFLANIDELAIYETQFNGNLLTQATTVTAVIPPQQTVAAAVSAIRMDSPISNLTITQTLSTFGRNKALQAQNVINAALLNQKSKQEAIEELTKIISLTKAQGETIIRTATNLTSNTVKNAVFMANSDVIDGSEYVAKLDGRTTEICRARDGNIYPVGQNPAGTLHWGCRSQAVPIVRSEYVRNDL